MLAWLTILSVKVSIPGTDLARRAFSVVATSTWNSLPAELRLFHNTAAFKRHLKTHFYPRLVTPHRHQLLCIFGPRAFYKCYYD